jgi:PLP dependent protein
MLTLANLYELVHKRIAIAAKHAGREPESVRLIAVSKGRPLLDIYALHQLGHRDFAAPKRAVIKLAHRSATINKSPGT